MPASTVTIPEASYDTLKLISFQPAINLGKGRRGYVAEVGAAALEPNGGYRVLKASIQKIEIADVTAKGSPLEQALFDQIEDVVAQRFDLTKLPVPAKK